MSHVAISTHTSTSVQQKKICDHNTVCSMQLCMMSAGDTAARCASDTVEMKYIQVSCSPHGQLLQPAECPPGCRSCVLGTCQAGCCRQRAPRLGLPGCCALSWAPLSSHQHQTLRVCYMVSTLHRWSCSALCIGFLASLTSTNSCMHSRWSKRLG